MHQTNSRPCRDPAAAATAGKDARKGKGGSRGSKGSKGATLATNKLLRFLLPLVGKRMLLLLLLAILRTALSNRLARVQVRLWSQAYIRSKCMQASAT